MTIWSPETFQEVRRTVYGMSEMVTDEILIQLGEAELGRHVSRMAARAFRAGARERWDVDILPGDITSRYEVMPPTFDQVTMNQKVIRARARWSPVTSEVLFQTGPLDGKRYVIQEGRIGMTILAMEAPVEPWFAGPDDALRPIVPDKIYYDLYSWDEELACWVYRPK